MEWKFKSAFSTKCIPKLFPKQRKHFCKYKLADRSYLNAIETCVSDHISSSGPITALDEYCIVKKMDTIDLEAKQLGLLIRLYDKYLRYRLPPKNWVSKGAHEFIIAAFVSFSFGEDEDFKPEHLWKIFETHSQIDFLFFIHCALRKLYSNIGMSGQNISHNLVHISYFGEFLYFCATNCHNWISRSSAIRQYFSDEEFQLMNKIAMATTPELGLLTYIALRNWLLHFHLSYRILCSYQSALFYFIRHKAVSEAYAISEGILKKHPELEEYFKLFSSFMNTDMSGCYHSYEGIHFSTKFHNLFATNFLIFKYDYDQGVGICWKLIQKCVMDILIFLHKESNSDQLLNLESFHGLPRYLEFHKNNLVGESEIILIFSCSKLLDFLFVQNWKKDFLADYLMICEGVVESIKVNFPESFPLCEEYSLFPFLTTRN